MEPEIQFEIAEIIDFIEGQMKNATFGVYQA
jgi:hypothetical protein